MENSQDSHEYQAELKPHKTKYTEMLWNASKFCSQLVNFEKIWKIRHQNNNKTMKWIKNREINLNDWNAGLLDTLVCK